MLHQPDPEGKENMMEGIKAIRRMHVHVIEQTGFTCAEEILYPENHRYLSDLLSYGAIGARSVEDQLHRMIASGANSGGHEESHIRRPFGDDEFHRGCPE